MNDRSTCLNDGELRALFDGEVAERDRQGWTAHLQVCPTCRTRHEAIRANTLVAASLLERIAPGGTGEPDITGAYQRFQQRLTKDGVDISDWRGASLMHRLLGIRRSVAVAGVTLVAVMILTVSFAPVGTLANNVLNRFRVQQFAAITIPMEFVQQFALHAHAMQGHTPEGLLGEIGNLTTNLSKDNLREAASLAEANDHVGGTLKAPANLPAAFQNTEPKVLVGDAGTAEFTLDVARAQERAQQLGVQFQSLPDAATTSNVTFSLDVPASAALIYEQGDQHLVVAQMASPTLSIPSEVNAEALREDLLMFPGLPADVAAQIRNVKDWQNTLIVPVPSNAQTSQETVDGSPALVIDSPDGAAVLWQKDGILRAVGGRDLTTQDVLSVAESLQ